MDLEGFAVEWKGVAVDLKGFAVGKRGDEIDVVAALIRK